MTGLPRPGQARLRLVDGPIARLVDEYLRWLRAGGRARTTRNNYAGPLRTLFVPFAEERGARRPEDLTAELVQEFTEQLQLTLHHRSGQPLSPASVRSYSKAVQAFLSWLRREKGAQVEPEKVPIPRLRKVHREVLSRQEVDQLEEAAPLERDKLIIRLMADTAMREGEVVSIRLQDLVSKDRYRFVRVRGKTGERLAPISPELFRRLKAYERGRPRDAHTEYLFLSNQRKAGEWRPLGPSGVYRLFEEAAERMNFPRRAYPHLLRHSAISWMVASGMPPPMVSEVAGVSIAVTMSHYFHSTDNARFDALMKILERERP